MSGSKNVNKNSTNLYCGCVLSFCESKCSQSCGVVSTRSAFCWSLSVTHTHTEAADYIHAHNTHSSICMAFALSLSLCVSTPAEILPPHCCSESPPFTLQRSGSKNLPSSSSSLPLCVFSFLLLGHTSSASQRSTGKASSVSLNSCNKQMHTRTADSLDLNLEKF